MSAARRQILERIADAVAGASERTPPPAAYRRTGALDPERRTARFCSRVSDYRADVAQLAEADVAARVETICAERGVRTLGVPAGVPADWRPTNADVVDGESLSPRGLDVLDGALTGCTAAVAETGTIILAARAHEGRRALTLVPDLHICVVREAQIVELLPEAFALLRASRVERNPLTFISGPSATSDIELRRVEGVHGPRTLVVLVIT